MNRELIERWIWALRSGRYRQGRWHGKSLDGSMCALGVLHELIGGEFALVYRINWKWRKGEEILVETDVAPFKRWMKATGIGGKHLHTVREMNDGECDLHFLDPRFGLQSSFNQIADYLEGLLKSDAACRRMVAKTLTAIQDEPASVT